MKGWIFFSKPQSRVVRCIGAESRKVVVTRGWEKEDGGGGRCGDGSMGAVSVLHWNRILWVMVVVVTR